MSSFVARAILFCFTVILGWLPLAAQSSNYHLEYTDHATGRDAILVNDSEKPIEAFAISQRCYKPRGGSGAKTSRDILESFGGVSSDIRTADGSPARRGVLETGWRWGTSMEVSPEKGDCREQIVAVLFSDGSFEGEDAGVRGLKAHRDGLAAATHYWADRIKQARPNIASLEALHEALKRRKAEDERKRNMYPIHLDDESLPLPWQYWAGWTLVEGNIEGNFLKGLSQEKASEDFRRMSDAIDQWKKKIDGNLALQKLNGVFPSLTESDYGQ